MIQMHTSFAATIRRSLPVLLFVLCLAPWPGEADAQTFSFPAATYLDSLKLRDIVSTVSPDTITVRQPQYSLMNGATTTSNNSFTVKSILALTNFKVDVQSLQIGEKHDFTYVITYKTIGIANPASPTPVISSVDTLSVSYNQDSLTIVNDKVFNVAGKFHELKVVVYDVFEVVNGSSGPVYNQLLPAASNTVPSFVYVFGEIHLQKFVTYSSMTMVPGPSGVTASNQIATTGTVNLDWTAAYNQYRPAGYEVEWTYVEPGVSNYNFRNNATRVFTNNTAFKIPVAQKEGHLVWRVRMVRPNLSNLLSRSYGAWTRTADQGAVSGVSANEKAVMVRTAHDSLNWDLKMSFVEDGKYKGVMTYYDGLLKQKQVQTRFNSVPTQTIIAQNLFDYEGRPVISTLPIPVSGVTKFSYLPNFLHPDTADEYHKLTYDVLPDTTACPPREVTIPRLDDTARSNKYYSRQNPDKSGYNAFIPDAEGYPMTRKVLAAENPEKVLFEGQAGGPLQLGNDRQTGYLYGSPIQAELNRYFGQDIGKYNYYRKMVTTDNHDQDMFSITDDGGKPIATGLIGTPDTNSLALSIRNMPSNDSFKSNLLPIPNIRIGNDWHANGSHFVDMATNYSFEYRIDYKPYQPCSNVAYRLKPKVYFKYEMIDNCGNIRVRDAGELGGIGVTTNPTLTYADDTSAFLEKGNHLWNKQSYIKMEDVTASVDEYLNLTDGCYDTFDDFLKREFEKTTFPCPADTSPCGNLRYAMMQEMYPRAKYGQYHYTDSATKTFAGEAPNSIFSTNRKDENGGYLYQNRCITYPDTIVQAGVKYTNIQGMEPQQLINIFNDSIAAALLPLHPDYCKLALCEAANNPYAKRLVSIQRADDAKDITRFYLDDIAASDPLVQGSSPFPFTAAQFAVTPSDGRGIDTLAFLATVCGSEVGTVQQVCEGLNAGKSPASILAYPAHLQDEYYRNLIRIYTASREERLGEYMREFGSDCGPCDSFRLTNPVADTIDRGESDTALFVGTMDGIKTKGNLPLGSSSSVLFSNSSTFTMDSLNALTNVENSAFCSGKVAMIVFGLRNCAVDTLTLNALRDTLTARFCTANHSIVSLTYDSLTAIMGEVGIVTTGLCNAGLANLHAITRRSGENVQLGLLHYGPVYYENLADFIASKGLLNPIATSAAYTTQVTLRRCDNYPFEQGLAERLGAAPTPGNCSNTINVDVESSNATTSNAVQLRFSYNGRQVDYYLYPQVQTEKNALNTAFGATAVITNPGDYSLESLFNLYGFDRVGQSYANRNTILVKFTGTQSGLQKDFRYFLSAFDDTADYTAMERDRVEFLNGVGCSELLPMVHSAVAKAEALGIRSGHPYFETFVTNVMNYDNNINFSFENYREATRSCGLTDSMLIRRTLAHFKVTMPGTANLERYLDSVRVGDTITMPSVKGYELGGTTYLFIDVAEANGKTIDSARQSLTDRLVPYGGTIEYLPSLQRDTLARLLSSAYSRVWGDSLVAAFPGATVDSAPVTLHYYIPGYGNYVPGYSLSGMVAVPNSMLFTVRKTTVVGDFEYNHGVDSVYRYLAKKAPMTEVLTHAESAVSSQYHDWQMSAWRSYVNSLSPANHNAVVKRSKAAQFAALSASNGPLSFGTSAFSYNSRMRPGYHNDLYIDHAPASNSNYLYLKQLLLNLETYNNGVGGFAKPSIFRHTGTSSPISGLAPSTVTRAYLCGDTTKFWVNHFNAARKMVNVFIQLPPYLPHPRKNYKIVTVEKGFERDSVTYLNLTLATQGPGPKDTIYCPAYCNLSLGTNYVIPSAFLTSHSNADGAYRFESCESAKLETIYPAAHINYGLYRDSMRQVIIGNFRKHIIDSLKESLNIFGRDIKHGVTLYYYDMAGNLIKTVSPAGTSPLSVLNAANDTINAKRLRNEKLVPAIPSHTKITSYRYNAQNKVIETASPDGGTTVSRYDLTGRVAFSQDAKQAQSGDWTYFIYDGLSRVIETGVVQNPPAWTATDYTTLGSSMAAQITNLPRREVTVTLYDTASYAPAGPFATQAPQGNLKNRVACVKYFEAVAGSANASKDTAYAHALHYSYDLSGNVKTLVHDLRTLARPEMRVKRVDYEYDLYSGKVLLAAYNRGLADQFYQRYSYDEDNRITEAHTSGNGIVWDRDAHYDYYKHGPLARTSLGEQRVQGVDYAYTINGWLKATNGSQRDHQSDMGDDGLAGGVTPPDVFSQAIHYFAGDYKAIDDSNFFRHLPTVYKNLYNGNIAAIGTALAPFANLQSAYHYDPLQRIDRARYTEYNYDHATSTLPTNVPLPDWASDYSYDKDGNLTKLKRQGGTVPASMNGGTAIAQHKMDSLSYRYAAGTNRLRNLQDSSTSTAYKIDIPPTTGDTNLTHYTYDATGNITSDLVSGLTDIRWNRFGKVSAITKTDGTRLTFSYDALGNRLAKEVVTKPSPDSLVKLKTMYVRDASGNSLAVYEEKKEYDLVKITRGVVAVDPTLGVGPGKLPASWTHAVAGGLIDAYNADPSKDLASLALSIPGLAGYAQDGGMMYDLLKSLSGPQALAFAKSVPATTHHALGGNAEEEGGSVEIGQEKLSDYLEPILLSKDMDDAQTALLTALKDNDHDLYYNTVRAIPATDQQKEDFPADPGLLEVFEGMEIEEKAGITAELAGALAGKHRHMLSAVRPVVVDAYSPATAHTEFVVEVPNGDKILDRLREDATGYAGFRYGLVGMDIIPLDTVAAQFKTNTVLASALSAQNGGGVNADALSTVVGDYFADLLTLADNSGQADVLTGAIKGTVGNILVEPFWVRWLREKEVLQRDRTFLAEHHIYGSSRLGMQKYLPTAFSFDGMAPAGPGTYQTLLQQKPWYSRYGGDLFLFSVYGSDTLGTSQMGTAGIRATAHILGQRHYELTNHLGNVQATVLDRVTPQFVKGPSGQDVLTGYSADISTAQDYYPFGMLMPGRYISDTARHCVTTTQTVMVQKPIRRWIDIAAQGPRTISWQFGGQPAPLPVGSLPVAQSFEEEVLHVYHYLAAGRHPNGWVARATAAQGGGPGLDYAVDLSGEPSGIPGYVHLHLDTSVESQTFAFGLEGDRNREVEAEVRVRQYAQEGSEEYTDAVRWTRVQGGGVAQLIVPVDKWAVAAGGRTVVEWRFSTRDGRNFGSNVAISIRSPWWERTQWVAENRAVTTCEERDEYRFGFNGKEKDNEAKGLGNSLDFGARIYDSRLGRFLSIDPKREEFPWQSTYCYADNRPILFQDIDGEGTGVPATLNMIIANPIAALQLMDARSLAIATRGALDAAANANTLGAYDVFGGDNVDEYSSVDDQISYTVGRMAGDVTSMATGAAEVEGGGTTAAAGLATGPGAVVVSSGGVAVALHGSGVIVTATVDLADQTLKLKNLYAKKPKTESPPPATGGSKSTATSSDDKLIQAAKDAQAKAATSKARAQNRQQASQKGNTGGRSNQDVRGSHHTNTRGGGDHDTRNARAQREQANATQSKKGGQK